MSNPSPLSPMEQQERLAEIANDILPTLPMGWTRLVIRARSIGRHAERETGVKLPDGSVQGWTFVPEVWRKFMELREAMYVPNLGTWVEFKFLLDPPGRFNIEYNRDQVPRFEEWPTRSDFAVENERFPRSDENMPEWYRLGIAGQPPQG
ncbi:hypothetical protein [Nocardia sp. CDC160]|uniref:hypothetical protein n=1 Tax=Nocardia sp. CDC160 TaxID=3112166 RepID=UPI002DBBADB9|nr:hypothetical protein [Nocardia sp. CDC160]MEC3913307.1 hypothetical protein [Nocardia sp. CDC160]